MISFRYTISIGADAAIEKSGPEKVRRFSTDCQRYITDEAYRLSPSIRVGNKARCWRLRKDLYKDAISSRLCGRPVCTLADVYSCSVVGCVQLTDPEEQLSDLQANDLLVMVLNAFSRCRKRKHIINRSSNFKSTLIPMFHDS